MMQRHRGQVMEVGTLHFEERACEPSEEREGLRERMEQWTDFKYAF